MARRRPIFDRATPARGRAFRFEQGVSFGSPGFVQLTISTLVDGLR